MSMGLCFDLVTVLEGHPNVVLAVDGDVVHHRQPVCFPELRQRLPAPQVFQVCFDLVLSGHLAVILPTVLGDRVFTVFLVRRHFAVCPQRSRRPPHVPHRRRM